MTHPSHSIRRLGPGDLPLANGMLELFGRVFDDPQTYGAARPGTAYLDRLLGSETFVSLVALDGGEVVGALTAYELPKYEQERSELYIYDLAVAGARRRPMKSEGLRRLFCEPCTEGRKLETISKARLWTGRILSGLVVLFFLFDGGTKVVGAVPLQEGDDLLLGYRLDSMPTIGAILLICTAIHLVPRLSLLGAILLTGYLGGAVASQVRVDNPLLTHTLFPIYVAAIVWGGLLLRRPDLSLLLLARPERARAAGAAAGAPLAAGRG